MTGWQTGRAHVELLIDKGWLEPVRASGDLATRLLHESAAHLHTARAARDSDPTGALQLGYDAARKAAIALLAAQGLRATTDGGHKATAEAAAAQFDGTFDRLDRMRRRRNDAEYPDVDTPDVTDDDAGDTIDAAQKMHDAATALINSGKLGVFGASA
ncbi:MAG TPA: HEPN domain-containing protein [Euzebyales bacterium]|nr:HEPN domain-containing protein [Euzebyales bacterium]